ncbi:hypothetical protein [Microbulbifer sp. SAOS-129_SWC]|uniref:hypothetical protein n=1 Tax=Microbulbifer sp. SAOS-129_SWC TaxID=3145235 RepID=UPI003216897B
MTGARNRFSGVPKNQFFGYRAKYSANRKLLPFFAFPANSPPSLAGMQSLPMLTVRDGKGKQSLLVAFGSVVLAVNAGPAGPRAEAIVVLLQNFFQTEQLVTTKTNIQNKYLPIYQLSRITCRKKRKLNYKIDRRLWRPGLRPDWAVPGEVAPAVAALPAGTSLHSHGAVDNPLAPPAVASSI